MTRYITESKLYVVPPATASRPSFAIPGDDIISLDLGAEIGGAVGQGSAVIDNTDGQYTTGDEQVRPDDRLYPEATLDTAPTGESGAGLGPAGVGPAGSGPTERLATGIAADVNGDGVRQAATLDVTIEPFVGNRLKERETNYAASGRPIATGDDADPGHLDAILKADAPEIARDRIHPIDLTVDFAARKTPITRAIEDLTALARAGTGEPVVAAPRGNSLLFQRLEDRPEPIGETLTLGSDGDLGEVSFTTEPPTATEYRVEGGIDDTNLIGDKQESVNSYETVTNSSRKQYRISVRKPEVSKVEVYTRRIGGSDGTLRVRLQADAGGAPVAPGDSDSDIVSGTADSVPSDAGGWQTVSLGEHTLPPTGNPWLIVEADNSAGIEVGVDGTGTVAFRAYFPKPVIVSRTDSDADETFRTHQRSTNDDSLTTFKAADDLAQALLEREAVARTTVEAAALSDRAHQLRPGDLVTLDAPWANAEGLHVVTERGRQFAGPRLETSLTFEAASTYT